MLSAAGLVEHFDDLIRKHGGQCHEEPAVLVDPTDTVAHYKARASFTDGSVLAISVLIETSLGYPRFLMYSYHYQDAHQRTIFRYDSAPHHLHLPTAPHHKHVGRQERPVPSDEAPSLHRVLTEVLTHVRRAEAP